MDSDTWDPSVGAGAAEGRGRSPRRAVEIVVLLAALLFLGGAIGYVIGERSADPPTSAVDVGFLVDMSEHHDQAVRMALMELNHGQDPTVRGFAQDVLLFQRSELGAMEVLLSEQGATRPDLDPARTTMAWMSMPTPAASMPGIASEDQLERLDAARGIESDRLFLELMTAHHVGGVHMAAHAAEHARDPRVRALAARMAQYQAVEIREYAQRAERLGLTLPTVELPEPMADGSDMEH